MKNSNDTIGNRTRDLPTCSAVPQPTAQYCLQIESFTPTTLMVPLACSSCAQVQCHARPLARSVPPSKPSSPCQHECIVIPWYVRPPVIAHATHVDFPSTPSSRNASYLSRFTCPMCFSISLCQIACMQPRGLDVISGVYVIVSTSHRAQVCGHLQIIYAMLCTDSKTHSCTLFY